MPFSSTYGKPSLWIKLVNHGITTFVRRLCLSLSSSLSLSLSSPKKRILTGVFLTAKLVTLQSTYHQPDVTTLFLSYFLLLYKPTTTTITNATSIDHRNMISADTARTAVGVLGNLIALGLFLSPV